jgi:CPA1 family monovalent cation:H+ antiporter
MALSLTIVVFAGLLLLVTLAEPVAARLRIPFSVLLAVLGVALGAASLALLHLDFSPTASRLAHLIVDLPIDSNVFLFVFAPLLLFQTALAIEARPMTEDAVTIGVLAVVAVLVATLVIGFALWPVARVPLLACLLVGSVVATTDPVAVVGIFRDVGAPARLRRLAEGESLLNDASAITLFVLFLGLILTPRPIDELALAAKFLTMFAGGAAFGVLAGWLGLKLVPRIGGNPLAQVSLSVSLPYLVYVISELALHVSGVVAVVATGIVFNLFGPSRITPDAWRHLRLVWEQMEYWASTLIFVLAALLVPKLLRGVGLHEMVLLGVLVLAAMAARAVILFGVLPVMTSLRLSPHIAPSHRTVMLWGGLRGAITLALALSVVENKGVPPDVQRFVAVLGTGFVLFTLLVQGTTMRPLIRLLGLHRLSAPDAALRRNALRRVQQEVAADVAKVAGEYGLHPPAPAIGDEGEMPALPVAAALADAAVTLARHERELVIDHFRERTISRSLVEPLVADADRLIERARAGALAGYRQEARRQLAFSRRFRVGHFLHRRAGYHVLLARAVAERFETLLVRRMIVDTLARFVSDGLGPIYRGDIVGALNTAVAERRDEQARALQALRLQYPDYAGALERFFLVKVGLRHEERRYDRLHQEGLIGPELHRDLLRALEARRIEAAHRPRLDLELDTSSLLARLPMLAAADPEGLVALARLLTPVFALPGERLIRRGGRGDAAYFIASGAVEVDAPGGRADLGRGDVFGEMALLTETPRSADVTALGYCTLLRLARRDFDAFLVRHPALADEIHAIAAERLRANRSAAP